MFKNHILKILLLENEGNFKMKNLSVVWMYFMFLFFFLKNNNNFFYKI